MLHELSARSILKASPTPTLVLLPDIPHFTIVEVNEAYLQATNTKESDLIGKPVFVAFPANPVEEDGDKGLKNIKASFKKVVNQKKPDSIDVIQYDIPIRRTKGFKRKYWIPTNYPVLDEAGEVAYIIHSPIDVTRSILAEQKADQARDELHKETDHRKNIQLQLSNEKTFSDLLINSLPGLFYLFDEHGKMIQWNKNLEDLTGYTTEEIKVMHPLRLISNDDKDSVREAIDRTFITGKSKVEAAILFKDGIELPFYLNGMAIQLNGRNYIIGTGFEISDLVTERTQRMRMSQIVEESKNEIYIVDEKTRKILYANAGARENLGYSLEELKRLSTNDIIEEENPSRIEQFSRQLTEYKKDKVTFKTLHRRADDGLYNVEAHMQLIEQDGQKVFVVIAMDITERVLTEAQINASLKEKEVLLGEIHHRVKNNLAIVSSLLKLQSVTINDEKVKNIIKESEGRIQAMAMIHELLYKQDDFSSIDFGMYLNKLLQHVSTNYEQSGCLIKKEVNSDTVFLDISTAVPCALIAHELLTNAYKHAFQGRDQGNISISLNLAKDRVKLKVHDNGVGFSPKEKGSKLGLMLIHGLVKQVKGSVISDTHEGTTFTISFPGTMKAAHNDNTIHQVEKVV
ncbi:MAG: PAS domain S-box protein [Balneolales bacterium]